jgi:hypothetical protein
MSFKPNFELNFRPSASPFKNDTQQGLTHGSAGLSTEFIIVDDDSPIMPKISPYGDEDFLNAESRRKSQDDYRNLIVEGTAIAGYAASGGVGKCSAVLSSRREKIRSFVRDYAAARGTDCAKNEQLRSQLTKWQAGVGIPTNVNGVNMGRTAKIDRAACFREEAAVQLQNVNAAIANHCLAPIGEQAIGEAELELQAAQQGLSSPIQNDYRMEQTADFSTPLLILGSAVLVGAVAFLLIRS